MRTLTKEDKETIGLLQIGTFLEYFDLMLYVHMAVLLEDLFFEKTNLHSTALVSAFAFCSTYILRPFGALFFGYIGDTIGRKTTVIITTFMMSLSCIIMANLPTYAQIGITATYLVTFCRVFQGLSSMGEIMGATIYTTEITRSPYQYPAVSLIDVSACLGGVTALGVASLVMKGGMNWRIAFWVGAGVAVIGSIARTKLRETPEFIAGKRNILNKMPYANPSVNLKEEEKKMNQIVKKEKLNKKTLLAFFCVYCGWPLCFYLMYMYFNPILSRLGGYTATDIIFHNFQLSFIHISLFIILSLASYWINPLKMCKWKGIGFLCLSLFLPFLIGNLQTVDQVFLLQTVIILLSLSAMPSNAIFVKHFPVLKRFTAASVLYALTRALVYIITSFGVVYLTEWMDYEGLWIILLPIVSAYLWGIKHFQYLENNRQNLEKIDTIDLEKLYSY